MKRLMHCVVDLEALIVGKPLALHALRHFDPEVTCAPTEHIQARAVIMRAQGMDVWPLCSQHDKRGYCTGHPT